MKLYVYKPHPIHKEGVLADNVIIKRSISCQAMSGSGCMASIITLSMHKSVCVYVYMYK